MGLLRFKSQFSSVAQSRPTLCNPMDFSTPGFPVHHQLPEPTQTHVHRVGDSIQPSHLFPAFCLQSFPASGSFPVNWFFTSRWPKYWSFCFSISPSNKYSGLISFRIDWFDLFAVQGTPKESSPTPQFKGSNSLVLSLLYGPTLTSVHDYWESYSFDYTDLCQQSDVSAF